eukprot:3220122-Pyramimonas_sp.AAC.1
MAKQGEKGDNKFGMVDVVRRDDPLTTRLPNTAFQPDPSSGSLPFGRIVSTSQKAPFYSPSASNLGVKYADLVREPEDQAVSKRLFLRYGVAGGLHQFLT